MPDRPTGRKRKVTGEAGKVERRGEGLGTGPVGSKNGYAGKGKPGSDKPSGGSGSSEGSAHPGGRPGGSQRGFGGTGNGGSTGVHTGSAGAGNRPAGKAGTGGTISFGGASGGHSTGSASGGGKRSIGCGTILILVLIVIIALFLLRSMSSDDGSYDYSDNSYQTSSQQGFETETDDNDSYSSAEADSYSSADAYSSYSSADMLSQLFGSSAASGVYGGGSYQTGWSEDSNTGKLDTTVASGSRDKYTTIKGDGEDKITILVYMIGTDLESQSGMATNDLSEMASANIDTDKINLIVYTGGCKQWKNSVVSSSKNQIYQVLGGGKLKCLDSDCGTDRMTDYNTLEDYIKWGVKNYPADRYDLILWDHGGGSVSGYGYDEKYSSKGSMSLTDLNKALKGAKTKFDFIGFDACLMATVENGLMLSNYADYLVASEETEPGIGWYYTDWLNNLSGNTSEPTIEIGQDIADSFVEKCASQCRGQDTTLSVVDLAELSNTVPDVFDSFSDSICTLLSVQNYTTVSNARNNAREFATSSKIDQVDLVDFATKIGNDESKALVTALEGAVKYNKTSASMTNAYGISVYFPYKRLSYVDTATSIYDAIGLNSNYSKCIRQFASLETSGQVSAGGTGSAYSSLFGDYSELYGSSYGSGSGSSSSGSGSYGSPASQSGYGGYSGSSSGSYSGSSYDSSAYGDVSAELIEQLLGSFLGGDYSSISGLTSADYTSDRALSDADTVQYLADNHFDASKLVWTVQDDGSYTMTLDEDMWSMVHSLDENLWLDDGDGYIDLGLDNVFDFTEEGDLVADTSKAWIGVNGQAVAYYHLGTLNDGENTIITGRIPILLTNEDEGIDAQRADLIVVFENDEDPYIAGITYKYADEVTDTISKGRLGINGTPDTDTQDLADGDTADIAADYEIVGNGLVAGDKIDFIADYYDRDGNFEDAYRIGTTITVEDPSALAVSDLALSDEQTAVVNYRFTDIYNEEYWSASITE